MTELSSDYLMPLNHKGLLVRFLNFLPCHVVEILEGHILSYIYQSKFSFQSSNLNLQDLLYWECLVNGLDG